MRRGHTDETAHHHHQKTRAKYDSTMITTDPFQRTLVRTAPIGELSIEVLALTLSDVCRLKSDPLLDPYRRALGDEKFNIVAGPHIALDFTDERIVLQLAGLRMLIKTFYPKTGPVYIAPNLSKDRKKHVDETVAKLLEMFRFLSDEFETFQGVCHLEMTFDQLRALNTRIGTCLSLIVPSVRPMIHPYNEEY